MTRSMTTSEEEKSWKRKWPLVTEFGVPRSFIKRWNPYRLLQQVHRTSVTTTTTVVVVVTNIVVTNVAKVVTAGEVRSRPSG